MTKREKAINALIESLEAVKVDIAFRSEVGDEWELFRAPDDLPYRVFIRYDNPREAEMVVVATPAVIAGLDIQQRRSIADEEIFMFKFLALIALVEEEFSDLTRKERERISSRCLRVFGARG